MTQNHVIAVMLVVGLIMAVIGYRMDKESSFDDGSFMIQIALMMFGAVLVAASLVWKFVLSFF